MSEGEVLSHDFLEWLESSSSDETLFVGSGPVDGLGSAFPQAGWIIYLWQPHHISLKSLVIVMCVGEVLFHLDLGGHSNSL